MDFERIETIDELLLALKKLRKEMDINFDIVYAYNPTTQEVNLPMFDVKKNNTENGQCKLTGISNARILKISKNDLLLKY